jgi:hypothetical protein
LSSTGIGLLMGNIVITEDDEFDRIEQEIKWRKDQPVEKLTVVYTVKLTQGQRVKLLQLGGPTWIRNQIERSTELCSLGENDTGQVRPRRLHQVAGATRGIGATQG